MYKVGLIWKHWKIRVIPIISSGFWFLVLFLLVAMIGALVPTMHRTTMMERQGIFCQNPISFRRTRISSYMAFLALQEAPNLFYQYH
jgi:hypothetical protein